MQLNKLVNFTLNFIKKFSVKIPLRFTEHNDHVISPHNFKYKIEPKPDKRCFEKFVICVNKITINCFVKSIDCLLFINVIVKNCFWFNNHNVDFVFFVQV